MDELERLGLDDKFRVVYDSDMMQKKWLIPLVTGVMMMVRKLVKQKVLKKGLGQKK